jgi:hypothetical protein
MVRNCWASDQMVASQEGLSCVESVRSSECIHCVVWYVITDISEEHVVSIIKVSGYQRLEGRHCPMFRVEMTSTLVGGWVTVFDWIYQLNFQGRSDLKPEAGGNMYFRNIGAQLTDYTVVELRLQQYESSHQVLKLILVHFYRIKSLIYMKPELISMKCLQGAILYIHLCMCMTQI